MDFEDVKWYNMYDNFCFSQKLFSNLERLLNAEISLSDLSHTVLLLEALSPDIVELVKEYADAELPIAKTTEIGQGNDSKAIVIGKSICLSLLNTIHRRSECTAKE